MSFYKQPGYLLICFLFIFLAPGIKAQQQTGLIPKPESLVNKKGVFRLNLPTQVSYSKLFKNSADFLKAQLALKTLSIPKNHKVGDQNIIFKKQNFINKETYKLNISPKKIEIIAADEHGALSAIFTLLQLQLLQADKDQIPCLEIRDAPRFSYRGLHLDVSRNFIPLNELEKVIDMMSLYKLNTFHWHLTDGPGWRLEIKKYPELTRQAAWRTQRNWKEWWTSGRRYSYEGNPNAYGGFYTQQEAKNLVAYAKRRGITIIPEIEMPGHSEEVTAIYPHLACSGKPYTQSELCLGNDSTFIFLQDVLKEVMDIFPSKYIHIGGDEADTTAWHNCPKCQARIKHEHLKNEHELQSYAVSRIEKFLFLNGRKLLGWDEILEGGIAPRATVMSWRGEEGGITAAKAGHDVIMTPGSYCYFDQYQSNPSTQPEAIGGFLSLYKVYSYEPIPALLTANESKHVLGAQANVWTEYIPTTEHLEYMIFPRLLALSEVLWTPKSHKNWSDFEMRLQQHYRLLQRKGINYYRPSIIPEIKSVSDTLSHQSRISISSEQYHPEIRYTLDGTAPGKESLLYSSPFYTKGISTTKAIVMQDGTKPGPQASHISNYHKAVGAKVLYNLPYSKKYPAKENYTLVNGELGSFSYGDGQWQGFEGIDMDITIEMPEAKDVQKIAVNFMQITGPGVYMPEYVEYSWSLDGKDFSRPVRVENTIPQTEEKLVISPIEVNVKSKMKFIRIKARNSKKGFLFADEVIVY